MQKSKQNKQYYGCPPSLLLFCTPIYKSTTQQHFTILIIMYQQVFGAFIFAACCRLFRSSTTFLILLNVLTFITFTYDKFISRQTKSTRISEINLFSMSLGGGWVGGVIAMILFTHKLRKSSFIFIMLLIISLDLAISFSIYKIF